MISKRHAKEFLIQIIGAPSETGAYPNSPAIIDILPAKKWHI